MPAPDRGRARPWSRLAGLLLLACLGCQRVGTTRIPMRGRVTGSGALWGASAGATARADLAIRRARVEFAAHPREVFRRLEAEACSRATAHELLTLGEVAYRVGVRRATLAPRESLEWYRDAAVYASFVVGDPALGPEAIELHNRAVTRCLRLAHGHAGSVRERLAEVGVVLEGADPDLDPRLFDRLDPAEDYKVQGLTRHHVHGVGVPLLAVRELPDRCLRVGQERFYGDRLVPPLTAVVVPEGHPTGGAWRGRPTRLVVLDPISHPCVTLGGRSLPLAADFAAPLAYQAEAMRGTPLEIAGAIDPERLADRTGVYLIHPHRPGKIPVLFVHGLASSPATWVPMFNELRADPALRARYEFWFAYYPTGYPAPVSVAMLRRELHDLQGTLDPGGNDPALKDMVVVGHSMGGLVSRMLIQSSGDALWNSFFTRPRGQVAMDAQARAQADSIFYFEPEPAIRRVIFIATPHRGANMANRVIGRVSSALVRRSPRIRGLRESIEAANGPEIFQPDYRDRMLSSIDNLEWESPILKTLEGLPLAPGVPYHSIVGNIRRGGDLDRANDGVVSYESAHFGGAESELMVPYFHSACPTKPESIAEVRRILHLHGGPGPVPIGGGKATASRVEDRGLD